MAIPETADGRRPARPVLARNRRASAATLALLAFAQLIISVDYNIVYVALPRIGSGLGFSAQHLQWVISAYAVAFGGFLLLGGRACDLFGPRRTFVLGLSLYGVSSLAGGLATGPGVLIAARAVQGIGGAFLFPATLTLVGTLFAEGRERNRAYSVWGAAGGSGLVVGALLGGVLTQLLGWRSVLYVNVPLALIAVVAAFRLIAPDTARRAGRRIDLPGALTSTLGVTALVVALVQGPESGWLSATVVLSAAAGATLIAVFLLIEARTRDPLMPLRLLRSRGLRTGMAVTFFFMATIGSLAYFLTLYFQNVLGYDALRTGLAYFVPMAAITAGSLLAGRVTTRLGTRAAMTGSLVLGAAGTATVALSMAADGSYAALVPGFLILGLGQGASYTMMFGAAAEDIAGHEQGIASGMASTAQQVGGAVGLAVLVGIAGLGEHTSAAATVDGTRSALLVATAGIALTAVVALGFPRRKV
ncbi:EmrB/QacA subfamily drug resistance transporter [Streptomyces sp. 840.1]|uniref:MFS transporter n=1 Tax=Streptomyces sp. 840.1 TaxID=2485152 RepID=UPI000F472B6A|nr:MFS transporter [Streptomyces sp. 840.1]ROQ63715.1 EmrB/QacA subfamily drug resistance transporter [Streptomyces sp. 840.1]